MATKPPPSKSLSLKARALRWLSQREHSREELRRKLLAVVLRPAPAESAPVESAPGMARPSTGLLAAGDATATAAASIEALLDELAAAGYLSEARFVESRLHARAARFGNRRILHELGQHGLEPDEAGLQALKASEPQRLRAVWERKFAGQAPASAQEQARQMRFLAGRGFSPEAIFQLMRSLGER